jgi:hypothetical protein
MCSRCRWKSNRFKYQPAEADARETGAMLLEYDLSNLAVWNFSSNRNKGHSVYVPSQTPTASVW